MQGEMGDLLWLIREQLYTAVLGDVLDLMGYRHQFLPAAVRPLAPHMKLVGWAVPVLQCDVFDDDNPFGLMFDALDSLQPGEVYLATGGSMTYAMWGELMTTAATARGAAGAVLNGYLRDTARVLDLGLPVFCRGSYAQDQRVRGRVIAYRVPVEIGGTLVQPGDLLVGDIDGVLAIPRDVLPQVVESTMTKAEREHQVRDALRQGIGAKDAFRQFGVM